MWKFYIQVYGYKKSWFLINKNFSLYFKEFGIWKDVLKAIYVLKTKNLLYNLII